MQREVVTSYPNIRKASGETVPFSISRLRHSLEKAGADKAEVQRIAEQVSEKLYEGIPTKDIYRMAFRMLKKNAGHLAAKYKLKRAIMELGPSGFPFEKFFAEILQQQGFRTRVGVLVQGLCVKHEIDVMAELGDQHYLIECKYHNQPGRYSDVKIPLYIRARFMDVEEQSRKSPANSHKIQQGWVVTNTRFSADAVQYGTCAGLRMIGWDYPLKGGLKDLVDSLGLYPITCLTTLTALEKQRLLEKNVVLCKEIRDNEALLLKAGVNPSRIRRVLEECKLLCNQLK